MIKRNERGKLTFSHLDMQILFDRMYEHCQTEEEVEWLQEQLTTYVDGGAEDARYNVPEDEEDGD